MKKKRRPNSTDVQVGESIRAHRLIAGMSQSALADRIGVSFQQVQKYEKGANRVGAGRLPQIAAIFNIPISALFEAHAHALPGKGTESAAPVRLIPSKGALKLLGSYADIENSAIRRCLIQLVDEIAKATRKSKSADHSGRVA
jgi:transcriptional regulator with XRE-family HTH domain